MYKEIKGNRKDKYVDNTKCLLTGRKTMYCVTFCTYKLNAYNNNTRDKRGGKLS